MNQKTSSADTLVPIAMIVAMSRNRVIGVDGKLPWYLPEDLKFFKRMTQGKPMIMGRKTFVSIGRALPGRLNIVVTTDTDFQAPGTRVFHDLDAAMALADQQATIDAAEEIMVIGGGEIFQHTLPHAQRLYVTEVDADVDGDAYFPPIDPLQWREAQRVAGNPAEGQLCYDFVIYERTDPSR
ncbi:dihydrofolate reductase [Halomonas sp. Bachu 37]|uniref:dihydrofolate reductase n=1 Tax=Halomonas kashgarensis TaxID=3084920 RepID=UPI00321643DD